VKARYGKSRNWAYKLVDWLDANSLLGIDNGEDAISMTAAVALAPVLKKNPKQVKQVTKKAEAIAKKNNHNVPTAKDFNQAKREVLGTTSTSKECRIASPDEYEISIGIDADNEQEVKGFLTNYTKNRSKFVELTSQPEMLLNSLSAFVGRSDGIELTINVKKAKRILG
jgi:hypothetical protein